MLTMRASNLAGAVNKSLFYLGHYMTINDMALVAGVSQETVRAKGKEMYPDKFVNGRKTVFNQTEAVTIMAELRKKGFVKPTENLELPTENLEVARQNVADDRLDRLEGMVEKLCLAVATIPQTIAAIQSQKQIEFVQDYYSIKGYASKIGLKLAFSDAIALGRSAGKLSREQEKEIRKVDDESYGTVNSYHVSILQEVFAI